MHKWLILLTSTAWSGAAMAQPADPLAPIATAPIPAAPTAPIPIPPAPIPTVQLPAPVPTRQIPTDWRGVFAAIRGGDWAGASAGITALPDGPLRSVARAELYTAKGSPMVDGASLAALLTEAPDLPQGDQLQRLAIGRISDDAMPGISRKYAIVALPGAPRRGRIRVAAGDPAADVLRAQLDALLKVDDATGAEALYQAAAPTLTPEGKAEGAQRVAWAYYGLNLDADTLRLADDARATGTGEWSAAASWIGGLAAWRSNDCSGALLRFAEVASRASGELASGGAYWAARAAQMCRRPAEATPWLLRAARSPESFYGLLARETLGMETRLPVDGGGGSTYAVSALPNVIRAEALAAIGERGLAEQFLRHQAAIGSPAQQRGLIAEAQKLDLVGAQYWLATNGQAGANVDPAARYPKPRWASDHGWRIDPALAYGHVIQESIFRSDAVSAAGAVGLMQVRPGTAADTARARGEAFAPAQLYRPETNLDHGQAFIEQLRANPVTQGQLPKVIAAYNAGPVPVSRWNYINDKGDPLLWVESIPYWETRFYVPAVMRNMWVYQGLSGELQATLKAMVQHRWPAFPTGRGISFTP